MTESHIPLLTYPAILLAVFAGQIGLPVPAMLFLIMAGALGASGKLSLLAIILTSITGCLVADFAWFQAGRWWGSRILRILCSFSSDRRYCVQRAREVFARWGLRTLVIAKFIPGLDGLTPPLAGLEGAGTIEFLLFDAIGSVLWSSTYCLTGYLFADHVEVVAAALRRISTTLAALLIVPLFCYLLWRVWELIRMVRQLRIRTVSPALLEEKLRSGQKIAVLDLLLCEGESLTAPGPAIPDAIRVDPTRLRKAPRVHVPDDVQMVLYCSSPKEIASARVAVALRHKGIRKVWVLEGGLQGWRDSGFPVTTDLPNPEEMSARFGITVAPRHFS